MSNVIPHPPVGPYLLRICAGCGKQINDGHHGHDGRLSPVYMVPARLESDSVPAEALVSEARIVEAQVLSLSHRQLGQRRRQIVREQVKRMYAVALGRRKHRLAVGKWREQAAERLALLEEEDQR